MVGASNENSRISRGFTRLGDVASAIVQRYLPDAFIFALLLTLVTMVFALVLTGKGPGEIVAHWSEGFWFVLQFSMQASLALLTGWALADSPPVKKVLNRIAQIPDTQHQAIFATAVVGQALGLFHWGVVLVGGAIFARSVGIAMDRQGVPIHYPLLVATAYAGLLPWHQGLSAAAPLLVATSDHFLADTIGTVPVSQTIFHPVNLAVAAGVVLTTVVIMPLMAPETEDEIYTVPEETLRKVEQPVTDGGRPADSALKAALLDSRLLCIGTGLLILGYFAVRFSNAAFMQTFNLNVFIALLLGLGLLFHGTLRSYASVLDDAVEGASQIMIQFQFYGGIMGIMAWSGLATLIAETAAQYASETTWYFAAFLAAGIVNFFVPSGGGQWVVTGEVLVNATRNIQGTEMNLLIIAFGMGDQWTNMIQPFWAIPVLGIAGLSIRDMMGYTAVLFVFSGLVMGVGTLLMGVL